MTPLDEKGRCCGRKPIVYKRDGLRFCDRCDRAFSFTTDVQIENFAWKLINDEWIRVASSGDPIE